MSEVTAHSRLAYTQAFRVSDASADKVLQPGWFALVDGDVDPSPLIYPVGTLVVIERTRKGLTERSIRRVNRRTKKWGELSCHTTVRRFHRDRVHVPTKGETVKVVGIVIGGSFEIAKGSRGRRG